MRHFTAHGSRLTAHGSRLTAHGSRWGGWRPVNRGGQEGGFRNGGEEQAGLMLLGGSEGDN